MNTQNFEYLMDNLRYMGFSDKLNSALEAELKKGAPEFQLRLHTEFNQKQFDAILNFRKSPDSDLYFFNSYHASLQRSNGEVKDQVFYLDHGKGITAKEAYNLLEGRAVYKSLTTKSGEPYTAWLQLDFSNKDKRNNHEVKQFHENYGFDLKAAVAKYAIAELRDAEKEKALLQSLRKGNLQTVSFEREGSVTKGFLEASPQHKSVTVYDARLHRVQGEALQRYRVGEKGVEPSSKQVTVKQPGQTEKEAEGKSHTAATGEEQAPGKRQTKTKDSLDEKGKAPGKKVKGLLPQKESGDSKKGMQLH